MADKNLNPDIAYQPKTKQYSFSTTPENRKKYKQKMSIIFALFFGIPTVFVTFCIIFIILNFFNLINLSSFYPSLKSLPKAEKDIDTNPKRISNTNQYSVDGVLYSFDEKVVKIKYSNKYLTFMYSLESKFYLSRIIIDNNSKVPTSETVSSLRFTSEVLKKENIGRNVTIQYRNEFGNNILQTLTLYE